ncbi:hypothetical protein K24_26785 [Klebsiella pneumoniae]|nr:hypothetical protein K24_26785 [Klebsiella pneumoniae]
MQGGGGSVTLLVIKVVRFMNGIPSTVSLKGTAPVMANTSAHSIQKRVSRLKGRIQKETLKISLRGKYGT